MSDIKVFVAEHHDPWFNLATEDWLFRNFDENQHVLFLWRNKPCIVIGRYQNPWNECDLQAMERDGVVLARRQSGGGTVWHDRGNLCFTFMSASPLMDRSANIALAVRALRNLGLDARANERLDILVDGRKVSGSAFRESSGRSFHHGTLLVRSDLKALERYLAPGGPARRAKGVKSVRSPVANLTDSLSDLTIEKVEEALATEAAGAWGSAAIEDLDAEAFSNHAETAAYRAMLASREWRFGASPSFARRLEAGSAALTLEIEGGAVREVTFEMDGALIREEIVSEALGGMEYDERSIAAALRGLASLAAIGEETGAAIGALADAMEEGRFS